MVDFDLSAIPDTFYDDPYPVYRALRERSPLHRMSDGSLFLTRYADVVDVYRHPSASSDKQVEFKPKYGDSPLFEHHTTSLVFNDPPLHTRVRRLLMGAVNQRAMNRMLPAVTTLVDHLLDDMAGKEHVDLIADFAAVIPIEVIGSMLAIPRDQREPLRDWSLAILGALEPVLSDEALERGNRAVVAFAAFLTDIIADRREHPLDPDEDVLTRLIQGEPTDRSVSTQDYDRLSVRELIHQCIFMLNAGHETTTNLIGNGTWLLLQNPDELQRLRQMPELIATAVEEMLRCEGPIQLNNRRLIAPASIGGQEFPAGTLITLCIGAAGRDPEEFVNPDHFDVGRKPNRHVAFGHSAHACVGMNIARMEGRIALGHLVARFSRIEANGEPDRDRRVRFRGFRQLPVRLSSR
ncbi:MAG: cytochrome P450 [Burkholderiaceae bacterium]